MSEVPMQERAAVERMFHGSSRSDEGISAPDSWVIDAGRFLTEAERQTREIGGTIDKAIELVTKAKELLERAKASGVRDD